MHKSSHKNFGGVDHREIDAALFKSMIDNHAYVDNKDITRQSLYNVAFMAGYRAAIEEG